MELGAQPLPGGSVLAVDLSSFSHCLVPIFPFCLPLVKTHANRFAVCFGLLLDYNCFMFCDSITPKTGNKTVTPPQSTNLKQSKFPTNLLTRSTILLSDAKLTPYERQRRLVVLFDIKSQYIK